MLKTLGVLAGGIFIGAVIAEVLKKKSPDFLKQLNTATDKALEGFKAATDGTGSLIKAFKEGLCSTACKNEDSGL